MNPRLLLVSIEIKNSYHEGILSYLISVYSSPMMLVADAEEEFYITRRMIECTVIRKDKLKIIATQNEKKCI